VLDRVLGRPQLAPNVVERDFEDETERAREKLAAKLEHVRAAEQENLGKLARR
jgi:hypothetical protein